LPFRSTISTLRTVLPIDLVRISSAGGGVFVIQALPQSAAGVVKDYFFFVSCRFKDRNGNRAFGFGYNVAPLPFRDMGGFRYPATESYPFDAAHSAYLSEFNTRVIPPP
jgi:hypothetical protein